MERRVRFDNLQIAVRSVFALRVVAHDDSEALKKMEGAGREFKRAYGGGDLPANGGRVTAAEVMKVVRLAERLQAGERGVAMQDALREQFRDLGTEIDWP
jgi:hypothetical protein